MATARRNHTRRRCVWAEATPALQRYHDQEYGFPVRTNGAYFERLILEIFQAGLSWRTILGKRRAFRQAFAGFDSNRVALFTEADQARLLDNAGIVRNRLKIQATILNAKVFSSLSQRPGGFRAFLETLPLHDPQATLLVLRRQFVFMGPKIAEEFLMSTGHWPVRHEPQCFLFKNVKPRRPE